MKNWKQAKELYIKDHLAKPLKKPQIRLSALATIEKKFQEKSPNTIDNENIFADISEFDFAKLYERLKGYSLNSAEKSVIHGLYKFAI